MCIQVRRGFRVRGGHMPYGIWPPQTTPSNQSITWTTATTCDARLGSSTRKLITRSISTGTRARRAKQPVHPARFRFRVVCSTTSTFYHCLSHSRLTLFLRSHPSQEQLQLRYLRAPKPLSTFCVAVPCSGSPTHTHTSYQFKALGGSTKVQKESPHGKLG